jgi:hypothetical protein
MSEQAVNTPLGTQDDHARVAGGSAGAQAADAESQQSRSGDANDDPSLEGIPREVIDNVGAYDTDSAGGCG